MSVFSLWGEKDVHFSSNLLVVGILLSNGTFEDISQGAVDCQVDVFK